MVRKNLSEISLGSLIIKLLCDFLLSIDFVKLEAEYPCEDSASRLANNFTYLYIKYIKKNNLSQ
jgi:hypothetical protein